MGLFGRRQAEDEQARRELLELRAELTKMQSVIRQLETEQTVMHDQVRKWMRRAVAAERVVERNQEPAAHGGHPATPAPPASGAERVTLRRLWGARARIEARRLRGLADQIAGPAQPPAEPVQAVLEVPSGNGSTPTAEPSPEPEE